jgi:hypothetical protein
MAVEELLARGVAPTDLILVSRTPESLERYAREDDATIRRDHECTSSPSIVSSLTT